MANKEQLRVTERVAVPGTNKAELMEIYSEWQNSDTPYDKLTKLGFLSIDALDPSPDMLKKAKGKDVYNEFFQVFLTREQLPIKENSYNSVVTCGSFMENHIPLEALPELIRIVKPGGIIVITTRYKYLDTVDAFRGKFQPFLDDLEKAGKWIQLQKTVFPKYAIEDDGIVWKYIVK